MALAPRPRYTTHGRHWWRDLVTATYRDALDARAALRESGHQVPTSVAGTAGAQVGYYQLTDEEFERAHPTPRFRDFLVAFAQGQREPSW